MTAGFTLRCPTAIGCRAAKTHTEIGWRREGEAEVSKNRSGNRSSCFPQQWNVLCFMQWCGTNSFRVWTLMQFCFDSICKEVSDLYPIVLFVHFVFRDPKVSNHLPLMHSWLNTLFAFAVRNCIYMTSVLMLSKISNIRAKTHNTHRKHKEWITVCF